MTWHREHCVEYLCALDVARPKLRIDHARALSVPSARAGLRLRPTGAAGHTGDDEHGADLEVGCQGRHGTSDERAHPAHRESQGPDRQDNRVTDVRGLKCYLSSRLLIYRLQPLPRRRSNARSN